MSFFSKLKNSFNSITSLIVGRSIDKEVVEEIEDALITADLGTAVTAKIIETLKLSAKNKKLTSEDDAKQELAAIIENILLKSHKQFELTNNKPEIILLCGVNGSGKTTMVGKLAAYFRKQNLATTVGACDTFRAAAVDQLSVWAERADCNIVVGEPNQDPASVAYKALEKSKLANSDVLLLDSAGRLNNKTNLMQELEKIIRVVEKTQIIKHKILVLDSTVGQNAINQVREFSKFVTLNGLIVNKLDGTAKAGTIINIAENFNLPIYFIGGGEGIDDIEIFDPNKFANSLIK